MIKNIDKKIYFALYNFTVSHGLISKQVVFITKFSSKFFSFIYFTVGAWLIYKNDPRLKNFILIPAAVYLIVKIIPLIYNRRRPFAEYKLKSLVKQREDQSFPSTHSGSSMIIALTVLNINLKLGVFMIFLSVLTSISRITVGVHYPTDILAAWIIAITLNFVGVKF